MAFREKTKKTDFLIKQFLNEAVEKVEKEIKVALEIKIFCKYQFAFFSHCQDETKIPIFESKFPFLNLIQYLWSKIESKITKRIYRK